MKKTIVSFILVFLLVFPTTAFTAIAVNGAEDEVLDIGLIDQTVEHTASASEDFELNKVIVTLKHDYSTINASFTVNDFSEVALQSVEDLSYVNDPENNTLVNKENFNQILMLTLKTGSKTNVLNAISALQQREDVLAAEPSYNPEIVEFDIPNDPRYSMQWALPVIEMPLAWYSAGDNLTKIKVAVMEGAAIDNHPDLDANHTLPDLFIDSPTKTRIRVLPSESEYHATAMASIIAAVTNNGIGIAGVAKEVSIQSLWGSLPNLLAYAANNNIGIVNMSFGYMKPGSLNQDPRNYEMPNTSDLQAIQNYKGLIVCSAGNQKNDNDGKYKLYPAGYDSPNLISVAATKKGDPIDTFDAGYSNYGVSTVHLAAPGTDLQMLATGGRYLIASGTSGSSAYVAGVAALIKSRYPEINGEALKYYIENNVDVLPSLQGRVSTGGRVNAFKAIREIKEYTVKYNANGGTGSMPNTTVIYGNSTKLRKNTFTKANNTFLYWHLQLDDGKWHYTSPNGSSGWYLEGNQPSGAVKSQYNDQNSIARTTSKRDGVITAHAQWGADKYTIKYDANGASGSMSNTVVTTTQIFELRKNTFTKAGNSFLGWYLKKGNQWYYTNPSGTVNGWYTPGKQPSGSYIKQFSDQHDIKKAIGKNGDVITAQAQWLIHNFTVKYNANGGAGTMSNTVVTYGINKALNANSFTRTGHTFLYWHMQLDDGKWHYTSPAGVGGWYLEGNQPSGATKTQYKDKQTIARTSSRNNAVITAHAQWRAHKYTIKYNANGATGTMSNNVITYGVNTKLNANSFTNTGHTFLYWYLQLDDGKWHYTSPNGSSGWYAEGKQPAGAVKSQYQNQCTVARTSSRDNSVITAYAQWRPNKFTIKYNANGGEGIMSNTVVTYGVSTKIRANTFTRPFHIFSHWHLKLDDGKWHYTSPNGTSGWYLEGKQPTGAVKSKYQNQGTVARTSSRDNSVITFYAQWEINVLFN